MRVPRWAFDFPIPTFYVRARLAEPGVVVYSEIDATASSVLTVIAVQSILKYIAPQMIVARTNFDGARVQKMAAAALLVSTLARAPI